MTRRRPGAAPRWATLLGLLLAACSGGTPPSRLAPTPTPAATAMATPPAAATLGARQAVFADLTDAAGIDFVHQNGGTGRKYLPEIMGSGGCALDYDGDRRIDLFLVQSGNLPGAAPAGTFGPSRLYRNLGGGRFADVTARAGLGPGGYGQGAVCADYDNDGHPDIYQLNLGPNRLWRNRGDGRFEDATARAGVGDPGWGSSAAFFDADRDGRLDLYVVNYLDYAVARNVDCGDLAHGLLAYCHPDAYPMAPDVYYHNRGDGRFEERTAPAGLTDTTGKGLGVLSLDFDRDGAPDLYVANDSTPNFLYRNRGDGSFEEQGLLLNVAYNDEGKTEAGMGVAEGDVDGDGRADLLVTNLSREPNALYLGGATSFRYASRSHGIYNPSYVVNGFGTDLADLDNDGDLDLHVVNGHVIDNIEQLDDGLTFRQPGQVFDNDGGGHFTELGAAAAGSLSEPRVGRGSVTVDFDDDGGLDLLVSYNQDRARLYRNQAEPRGQWIGFWLEGRRSNRDGIGARIGVTVRGRIQWRERRAGASYQTSSDPRLHFGLGESPSADRVEVHWPSGETGTASGLAAGRYYLWVEGAEPVALAPPPGP